MNYDIFLNDEVDFCNGKHKLFLRRDTVVKKFPNKFIGKCQKYMKLDSDVIKMIWLAKCLKKNEVSAYVTKAEIRNEVNASSLMKIAENGFIEKINDFPGYDFSTMERTPLSGTLSVRAAGFVRWSEKMAREGFTPPGLFLYVDKYDLHIFNSDEFLEMEILDNLTEA